MKKLFATVFLVMIIGLSGQADAKVKLYKSNSDMPFVEMMLGMMVAMGILDKIPPELIGLGGYSRSPWGHQNTGYRNLSHRNRIKQYLASRYLGNRYPGHGYQGYSYPGLGGLYPTYSRAYPGRYGAGTMPSYQNPMLGFPGISPFRSTPYRNRYRSSANVWQPMRPSSCIEGSCLSWSSGSLNGLWINEDGEMLGIKNDQFLWTDGLDMHLSGLMNISDDHVVANVDGSNQQISYDYRVQGNELLTRDDSGVVRNFWRYQPGYQSGLPLY